MTIPSGTMRLAVVGAMLHAVLGGSGSTAAGGDRLVSREYTEPELVEADFDHWAFQPLRRTAIPDVVDGAWSRTPVDRFLLAAMESRDLEPMPDTDRLTWLRRVTIDLTGLPPTPTEMSDFVADDSPDAHERVVDRLLASPAYGERWAQHWLDLARFAETDGFEHDKVRGAAWRYRDWVVRSLNADRPADEFIRLQIAGDELRPGRDAALIATGFLLCGPDMPDINDQTERRHVFLNDVTGTVGSVFLGLQFGCAQCHDHEYDPIRQADFYRLRAFFDHTDLFRERPLPEHTGAKARAVGNLGSAPRASHLWIRGDFRRPGPTLEPDFPPIANRGTDRAAEKVAGDTWRTARSGRRAALARWLTRDDHPLVTRVLVNRLWQHHFGVGLVPTASDFGLIGDPPTHPRLLDWLATELPRREWSTKALHRLLVTSRAYRIASRPENARWSEETGDEARRRWRAASERDRENVWLARFRRRRLSGEAIRDGLLAASGRLNRQPFGPGVRPPLPKEMVATLLRNQWPVTPDVRQHDRRSLYLFVRRNLPYPMFKTFDRPDTNASCPNRDASTTAPQALELLNSELARRSAGALATRLMAESDAPRTRVEAAFVRVWNRPPTREEQAWSLPHAENRESLADLCLALLNANAFLYVD